MKKSILLVILLVSITSLISAEIIINEQPQGIYNLGDEIQIPVTIKTVSAISGIFEMNLICNGQELNFYKNGVGIGIGGEQEMTPSLILTKQVIGELKGVCVVKSILRDEFLLSNEFIVSNLINVKITSEETEFNPGENVLVKGEAIKENGKEVEGFAEIKIEADNSTEPIIYIATINKGFFLANISTPTNMKSGFHSLSIKVYEKDSANLETNKGFSGYKIKIMQIPTSLEIIFENSEIEPGTNLKVKSILHDQTGEKIDSILMITIKNNKDKILEKTEISTNEFFEFPIKYNEPPNEWKVIVGSNDLTSEETFSIKAKKEVKVEIINKTLILENIGNVPYEDIILLKIGENSLNINTSLKVDETQKYTLTAPDGEYQVEILGVTKNVVLTGKTIDIKENSSIFSLVRYPFVWIFVIFILGFVAFTVFRKGYKRSFIGHIRAKITRKKTNKPLLLNKNSLIHSSHKAELSLSIKGDKQNISVVCLNIKNLNEYESKKGSVEDTLQKIVNMAEANKASTYENQNNLFFMIAPIKTKTFKNEKTALTIANKIKEVISQHNKILKDKIKFGISLNYGAIIAKQDQNILRFMSLGTLITTAKKIASLAHSEILLSEKMNERLVSDVRTEKHTKDKIPFYSITRIKHHTKNHEKFIRSFLDRIDKDKKK